VNINDIKNAGLKITAPRIKILEILEKSQNKHLTADDIYKELLLNNTEVGVATIYRVLTQFEQVGIVNKLNFENNQAIFELSDAQHHDHIVCTNCGKIEEFNDNTIEKCQEKIADKFGFKLTDHSLYLYGLCKDCQ
jgi:Fur family ferric uptake transcriptional regulator